MKALKSLIHSSNAATGKAGGKPDAATLLVIQSNNYDWEKIFAGHCLQDGRTVNVQQVGWEDLVVQADSPSMSSDTPILVHAKQQKESKSGDALSGVRTLTPDFVLVRNEVRGVSHTEDWRNVLFGLMFAGIPSVNSLSSIYSFLERPIVQAELNKIQKRLGVEQFPLIPQSYFSSYRTMMYGNKFPAVLKVGHAHAGAGKMKVANHHDWEDVRSVVAMTDGKYCTAEPFVVGQFDIRIQKIGKHYRAYRRVDISGTWKTNTGCAMIEEIALAPTYKLWADEASKLFGGLDICTVDVICECDTGKEYILEVNGTSSGLLPECAEEDNAHIRELVLEKMNRCLVEGVQEKSSG